MNTETDLDLLINRLRIAAGQSHTPLPTRRQYTLAADALTAEREKAARLETQREAAKDIAEELAKEFGADLAWDEEGMPCVTMYPDQRAAVKLVHTGEESCHCWRCETEKSWARAESAEAKVSNLEAQLREARDFAQYVAIESDGSGVWLRGRGTEALVHSAVCFLAAALSPEGVPSPPPPTEETQ